MQQTYCDQNVTYDMYQAENYTSVFMSFHDIFPNRSYVSVVMFIQDKKVKYLKRSNKITI